VILSSIHITLLLLLLLQILLYIRPSDASTDPQGTLGIDPRAGTNFALGPLSDRILISGGPCGKWSVYTVQKTEDIYQVIELLTDRE